MSWSFKECFYLVSWYGERALRTEMLLMLRIYSRNYQIFAQVRGFIFIVFKVAVNFQMESLRQSQIQLQTQMRIFLFSSRWFLSEYQRTFSYFFYNSSTFSTNYSLIFFRFLILSQYVLISNLNYLFSQISFQIFLFFQLSLTSQRSDKFVYQFLDGDLFSRLYSIFWQQGSQSNFVTNGGTLQALQNQWSNFGLISISSLLFLLINSIILISSINYYIISSFKYYLI